MGNCISLDKDSKCYFCNKDLSYRYLKTHVNVVNVIRTIFGHF